MFGVMAWISSSPSDRTRVRADRAVLDDQIRQQATLDVAGAFSTNEWQAAPAIASHAMIGLKLISTFCAI